MNGENKYVKEEAKLLFPSSEELSFISSVDPAIFNNSKYFLKKLQ